MPTVKAEIERLRALIADEQEKRRLRDEPGPEEAKTPHHERTGHWAEARQAIRNEAWNMMLLIEYQARVIAAAREALDWYSIRNGESVERWEERMITRAFSTAHDALALISEDAEVRA